MPEAPDLSLVPDELKRERRWVTWSYKPRGAKMSKPPIENAAIAAEWLSVDAACELVRQGAAKREGVGYVLGDGLVGVDLDACIDDAGELHEIAQDALKLRSYTETSPGGNGLHVLIRGAIPRSMNLGARDGLPKREIYDGGRYFTMTGRRVGAVTEIAAGPVAQSRLDAFFAKWFEPKKQSSIGADLDLAGGAVSALSDDEVFAAMFRAKVAAKWRALVGGDWTGYPSQSEADLALVSGLRFYTRADRAQIDGLFRKTGLMRPKWDERHGTQTYGEMTISKVIERGGPIWAGSTAATLDVSSRVASVPFWVVQRLKGAYELPLRVYCAIAVHADAEGVAYPSQARIAELCRVTDRAVRDAIATLKRVGAVEVDFRANATLRFRLCKTPALTVPPLVNGVAAAQSQDSGFQPSTTYKTPALTVPTNITTGGEGEKSPPRAHAHAREDEPCLFFTGDQKTGETCRRCGVPWLEHDGIRSGIRSPLAPRS